MDTLKLTSRGRYAVMAMVALTKAEHGLPVPLADIAENGSISISYLEQLIAALRRHDLVKSYRGPGGGYLLNKPQNEITIADIVNAAEDSTPAKKGHVTGKSSDCPNTQELWNHIGIILHAHLKEITLDDVARRHIKKAA